MHKSRYSPPLKAWLRSWPGSRSCPFAVRVA